LKLLREEQAKWPQTVDAEIFSIWKSSVTFFNDVYAAVKYFPKKAKYNLDTRVNSAVLRVPNHIAKGSKAKRKEEFQEQLWEAIEAVHLTVSALYIAKQYKYISQSRFDEFYHDGEMLVQRLKEFKGEIFSVAELN